MKSDVKVCPSSFSMITLFFFCLFIFFPTLKRMRHTLTDCVFQMKQHFTCVEHSRHNCSLWGSESPYDVNEHEHDSLSSMWCTLMKNKVVNHFVFEESTMTGDMF